MLLTPPPLSQTVTPSRTPTHPSSVTYFMDGPVLASAAENTLVNYSFGSIIYISHS